MAYVLCRAVQTNMLAIRIHKFTLANMGVTYLQVHQCTRYFSSHYTLYALYYQILLAKHVLCVMWSSVLHKQKSFVENIVSMDFINFAFVRNVVGFYVKRTFNMCTLLLTNCAYLCVFCLYMLHARLTNFVLFLLVNSFPALKLILQLVLNFNMKS